MSAHFPLSVILNPAASGGRGRRMRAKLEEELRARGFPFALSLTRGPGHAGDLTREAMADGHHRIMVVGGDGTIHEVANAILEGGEGEVAMAVAPVGTGNDFYRMVAPSRLLSHAMDALEGEVHRFDVGEVRYEGGRSFFVNLLGVGLDVEVLRRRGGFSRLSGLPQYLAALSATLLTFRPIHLRMVLNAGEECLEGPTMVAGLTVGPSIGGGFMVSPDASPTDGLLDLFFVDPLGMAKVARYIPSVLKGTHRDIPEFHFRQVRSLELGIPDGSPFFFEMDGELMPAPTTKLEIEVRPGVLPVLLPPQGAVRP